MNADERVCSGKHVLRVGTLLGDMRVVVAQINQINPLKLQKGRKTGNLVGSVERGSRTVSLQNALRFLREDLDQLDEELRRL